MRSYLREGTIVPEITLVREAVADETKLALLDILLDGVQEPTLLAICIQVGYMILTLPWRSVLKQSVSASRGSRGVREFNNNNGIDQTYLKLAIGPSWDLNDHVQDSLLLVGIQRDIMEG